MATGTVKVNLKKDWFGPDASLYQARDNPHEFPAEYAEAPKKADDETDEDWKVRQKAQPYAILPSTAKVLEGGGRTVATLQDTANGSQVVVAQAVEDEVKSVGGALNKEGFEEPSQSVGAAESAAEDLNIDVGGKPRQSGPLPAGHEKKKSA